MGAVPYSDLWEDLADRYALVREIGAGGAATVFLARDLRHQRDVAIKVLRPELALSLGRDRFLREIRIIAGLSHPHILPLYDSGAESRHLFYVMPYVRQESIADRLARDGELPVRDAIRLLRDVADALAYAHSHGVIHRDIKPGNVLLQGKHAVVADFGVAKALDSSSTLTAATSADLAIGTPAFMSPEQATADHVDARSDVYALGCLAYAMLVGRPPIGGGAPAQVLARQITEKPVPIREHRPAIPEALAVLVMRCLEKKPADRWQSCEEVVEHSETLLTPSDSLTPITPLSRPAHVRSGPLRILGAAVVAGAFALAIWRPWSQGRPAFRPPASQSQVTYSGHITAMSTDRHGAFIAYTARTDSGQTVTVFDVASGSHVDLVSDPEGLCCLSWSPDGSRLLVGRLEGSTGGSLWAYPRLGGEPRRIPAFFNSRWSSDASKVFSFASNWSGFALYDLEQDRRVFRPLAGTEAGVLEVAERPDAALFAFATPNLDYTRTRIFTVPLDSAARHGSRPPFSLAAIGQSLDGAAYRGRRVRLRGRLRSVAPAGGVELFLRVFGPDDRPILHRGMASSIVRSPEWDVYDVEAPIPDNAERVLLGVIFKGRGDAWVDDLELTSISEEGGDAAIEIVNGDFEEGGGQTPFGWSRHPELEYRTPEDPSPYNTAHVREGPDGSGALRITGTLAVPPEHFVTSVDGAVAEMRWDESGQWLYYLVDAGALPDLWKVWIASSGEARGDPVLVRSDLEVAPAVAQTIDVAADNRFYYIRGHDASNLWHLPATADGNWGLPVRVTAGTSSKEGPRVSPDGRTVAFVETSRGVSNVYLASLDGGARQLTYADSVLTNAAWSADGRRLVHGVTRDGRGTLAIVDVEAPSRAQILSPSTSQASGFTFFAATGEIGFRSETADDVILIDPATGAERFLLGDSNRRGWLNDLRVSPDGMSIVGYWQQPSEGVYRFDLDTGETRLLIPGGYSAIGWSADGSLVYALDPTYRNIWEVPSAGGEPKLVTTVGVERVEDGAVLPDGGFVLLASESEADIWAIDGFDDR